MLECNLFPRCSYAKNNIQIAISENISQEVRKPQLVFDSAVRILYESEHSKNGIKFQSIVHNANDSPRL